MTRSSGRIVRLSCASRAVAGPRPAVRMPVPALSPRQRLLVTHLLDLAKYLADDACPAAGDGGPKRETEPGAAYRSSAGRRSDAMGLFRRSLAMANTCCLESVRRELASLREAERGAGDHSRAEAVSALLSEVDLRLTVFRDLRIGRAAD